MIYKLFEPIRIGSLTVPNRVVMTAMHLNYTPNGQVNDTFLEFYRARAKGGAGLIIVGGAEINEQASGLDFFLSIKDDQYIPGLKRLTDAVHSEGSKIAVQLYMAGAYSYCGLKGLPILAPSEFISYFTRQKTTAMTREDIQRVQDDYAKATVRAKEAGFDAVEILASAGYLISQFLSPKTNKRDDEYGGSLRNRMRFGIETIHTVREKAGQDMAVLVRVAGNDFVPGSHTNKEAKLFASACQEAGVDCINVTGGWHESRVPQITMDLPQAGYTYLARGIKEVVSVPVIACNRINDPFVAEEVLKMEVADLVGVARGLIADPDFVSKSRQGKFQEVRRCVACNQRCFDHVFQLLPVGCIVNPRAGREAETVLKPATEPKRILVAGAGPAGCEFSLIAAQRGHRIILCDKGQEIGGQVSWSAKATNKYDFHYIFDYYREVLPANGIEIRLETEVTPELVAREKPDMVIVATGAAPFSPPIDAVNAPNVYQAWDVLKGQAITGRKVIVVGGGSVGLETAIFLASKGTISPEQLYFLTLHEAEQPEVLRQLMLKGIKEVTVLEMLPRVAQDVGPSTRWVLMKEVQLRGIKVVTGAKMKDIASDHVVYTDAGGSDVKSEADSVVLAMGARPENSLAASLQGLGIDVRIIGDAKKVGRIGEAIEEGFKLASEI